MYLFTTMIDIIKVRIYNFLKIIIPTSIDFFNICFQNDYYTLKMSSNAIKLFENSKITIETRFFEIKTDYESIMIQKKKNFKIWNNSDENTSYNLKNYNKLFKFLLSKININLKNVNIIFDNFELNFNNLKFFYVKGSFKFFTKNVIIKFNNNIILNIKNSNLSISDNSYLLNFKRIKINLIEKIIQDNLIEYIFNIINNIEKEERKINIYVQITSLVINLELQNYIKLIFQNIVINNNCLNIEFTYCKNWKKEILWMNEFKLNFLDKKPLIYGIRYRIFKSSGIKIKKTISIIRKRLDKIFKNNENDKITNFNYDIDNIIEVNNNNFLSKIIDDFLIIKMNLIGKIDNLEIILEPIGAKFFFNQLSYKQNNDDMYIFIKSWKLSDLKYIYICKSNSNDENFIIKIGINTLEIYPYSLNIILDVKQYGIMFGMTIENFNCLFNSFNSNTFKKNNYLYNKFHIQSFSSKFTYIGNNFSIDNFISGNFNEIINLVGIKNIDLIIPNNTIMYPKNWTFISQFILNKLYISFKNLNFKNLVDNKTIIPINKLFEVKSNFKYFKKKAENIIHNYN